MGEESVGDSIKDSDPGDKHWLIRERVPWQSPIAAVKTYCEGQKRGQSAFSSPSAGGRAAAVTIPGPGAALLFERQSKRCQGTALQGGSAALPFMDHGRCFAAAVPPS